jgi:hypothetical protein
LSTGDSDHAFRSNWEEIVLDVQRRFLFYSSQKYVPIGLTEHTSALAGLTIVEPSHGSTRGMRPHP